MEFPILDGVPILSPDPRGYVATMKHQLLARQDMAAEIESALGDAAGPEADINNDRYHLSLYGWSHYADWTEAAQDDGGGDSAGAQIPRVFETLTETTPLHEGPVVDLGASVGRGTFWLADRVAGPVLGADMNFAMLRLAQTLLVEGRAEMPLRRIGMVYDRVEIHRPESADGAMLDFWAFDVQQAPFPGGQFGTSVAVNLVDCVAGPALLLQEMARLTTPGGLALLTTPYDWATSATEPAGWFGGHSQRGPNAGAGEPVMRAHLAHMGLEIVHESERVPWTLRIHGRAEMRYAMHAVVCRRSAE